MIATTLEAWRPSFTKEQGSQLPIISIPQAVYPAYRAKMLNGIPKRENNEPPVIQLMDRVVGESLTVIGDELDLNRVHTYDISNVSENGKGKQASDVVNIAYSLRYNGQDGQVAKIARESIFERDAAVFVSLYEGDAGNTVMGTMRTVLGNDDDLADPDKSPLELFRYFAHNAGEWPHQTQGKRPAEVGRFGMNELVSALADYKDTRGYGQLLQRAVFRSLWTAAYAYANDNNCWVGYIASPAVNEFLRSGGLYGIPISGLEQNTSDAFQVTRTAFPRYWHPNNPKRQPIIYEAPTTLGPISCQLPDGSEIAL